jgi:hypothetical protein
MHMALVGGVFRGRKAWGFVGVQGYCADISKMNSTITQEPVLDGKEFAKLL